MCRMVAYYGPPKPISSVLTESSHGLVRQSFAPREMTRGLLNADGWGVGWFDSTSARRPGVIRGVLPAWSDENLAGATPAIASGSFVAIVRSATPGLGVSMANTPPFAVGDRLLAHNGQLWPWPVPIASAIRRRLDPEDEAAIRGTTDSELLGALWRSELRRNDNDESGAIRTAIRHILDEAMRVGGGIVANLLLVGASGFTAVRFADPGPAPSFYLLRDEPRWPGGILVASEPLDDSTGWSEVPPSTLVRVDALGVHPEPFSP